MGSVIGILSTVILVSTVCTLIFAVGAYIMARGNREGVNEMVTDGDLPGEDKLDDQFPHGSAGPVGGGESGVFRQVQPGVGGVAQAPVGKDDEEYLWK